MIAATHPVDHKTERRPPPRVGNERTAMLPKVLEPVARKADDKQPRCAGDRCGGDDEERAGDAAFDGENDPASVGDPKPV